MALLISAVYFRQLGAPFLLDDAATLTDNPSIRQLTELGRVFNPPASSFSAGRPLLNLSFALNHASGGLDPRHYRATNVAIHIANAFLLWALLAQLLPRAPFATRRSPVAHWIAPAAALLWALHPIQTVCVTYVSQRAESLMATFYLLTLLAFVRSIEAVRPARWTVLAGCAAIGAVMVKEVAVTAPLACLLLDRAFWAGSFRSAFQLRRFTYAALGLSWLVLAGLVLQTSLFSRLAVPGQAGISLGNVFTQLRALGEYAILSFWPHPLIFDRGATPAALAQFPLWRGATAVLALGGFTLFAWRRSPALALPGLLFLLLLLPTSSVIPVWGQPIAENRLYLPLASLCAGLAWAGVAVLGRPALILAGAGSLAASVLTSRRNEDYRSAERIWTVTCADAPANARARGALGVALLPQPQRRADALAHLETSRRMNPLDPETHFQLAGVYESSPATQSQALASYAECVRLSPSHALGHVKLGMLLLNSGRITEALPHLEQGVALRPDRVDYRVALGVTLTRLPGRHHEGVLQLETAVSIAPQHAEAHLNLGNALLAAPATVPRAIQHFETALRLNPNAPIAWHNLGVALTIAGRRAEAARCYENALRLAPGFTSAATKLEQLRQPPPAADTPKPE
jgi:Flp pilus assembly protein TadD